MRQALRSYLAQHGYQNVMIDFMPDEKDAPECLYLGFWHHNLGEYHDGTSTRYVQIQARRRTAEEAVRVCDNLIALLDSGDDEDVLHLTPDCWCIARPRRGPVIHARGAATITYACEIALWGPT